MLNVLRIARKELGAFFSSPVAYLFIGVFLAANLFIFFWVETFFSRNIADVRPLFEWMPVLLIFLAAALTMRMWSEERRMGTLEFLMTLPVSTTQFVLGKFVACMALVVIALLLTLPIPITVAQLGAMDWGPVIGAYLATLLLAAAYIAIGLFVSARSESQIISLIGSVLLCGLFYLVGAETLSALVGNQGSELLKLLGSGSRFDAINRGVIDARDLYYYLSIVGVFLTLNIYTLEKLRWTQSGQRGNHNRWRLVTVLLVSNFLAANVWLEQVDQARVDITEGDIYSISDTTKSYLEQLNEPLLIRGYFSAKTHPLLAPLVPRLRDLIREYAVVGDGKVRVEFIDPMENPALEKEAGQKFGIRPVPFQIASKYQTAVVNSYFDVLIQYGDQYEVLSFRDLIEIKALSETDFEIELRNPEYDITRSIKKVLYGYQGSGDLFLNINHPVLFKGYISDNSKLPQQLVTLREELEELLAEYKADAGGKLLSQFIAPDAGDGQVAREIEENFGFRPMATSLLDDNTFYFYMTLEGDGQLMQIPLPEGFDKEGIRRSLEAGLKRFATGFLKTVALHTPPRQPHLPQFGMMGGNDKQFQLLQQALSENANVTPTNLKNGHVPEAADLLVVTAPQMLDDKQLFAVDQFLMKGGTLVLATSPFDITANRTDLLAKENHSGLGPWLKHNGIDIEKSMVLDPQNTQYPVPVTRNIGGFTIQEMRMVEYPYFVDIRDDGMEGAGSLTAGMNQLTMSWPSPINIDASKNHNRQVSRLLESSAESWTAASLNIVPDFQRFGQYGFQRQGSTGRQLLAVAVEGSFDSYFKGKASPLLNDDSGETETTEQEQSNDIISGVIDKSPQSARIILFAANEMFSDSTLELAATATGTQVLNPLQLMQNTVDWSLQDRGLLAIRSRGHFSRMLIPLEQDEQQWWEYLNYASALLGLLAVYLISILKRRHTQRHYKTILNAGGSAS